MVDQWLTPETRAYYLKVVSNLVESVSQDFGHPVTVAGWRHTGTIDRRDVDLGRYTGPPGHVWQLLLVTDNGYRGSIGFTSDELLRSDGNLRDRMIRRMRRALGKLRE